MSPTGRQGRRRAWGGRSTASPGKYHLKDTLLIILDCFLISIKLYKSTQSKEYMILNDLQGFSRILKDNDYSILEV